MSEKTRCPCGSERVLVQTGSVVRVTLHGLFPHHVDVGEDLFEPLHARCAGCGATGGSVRADAIQSVGLAAQARAGLWTGMAYGAADVAGESLPFDEALCGCGRASACLVLYGDAVAVVKNSAVVARIFRPRADLRDGLRWECPDGHRIEKGSASSVAAARAAAAEAAVAFLERVPDLHAGTEPPPLRVMTGWPARARRTRTLPAEFPSPVEGVQFMEERWLEGPRQVVRAAGFVAVGFRPATLRAVYPPHTVLVRGGAARPPCGGSAGATWMSAGLQPGQAKSWFDAGLWPCCARRFAGCGFSPDEAALWLGQGFAQPSEAEAWDRERFGAVEAGAWADAGVARPAAARACSDAGLTPAGILDWSWLWGGRRSASSKPCRGPSPTAEHVAEVRAWQASGTDGGQARQWIRAGLTPADAALWPPGHPDRPDDDQIAAMIGLA